MTDRHAGYVVTLADDIREDDAEDGVLTAIRMIRGVVSVQPVMSTAELDVAKESRDRRWRDALWALASNGPGGKP
jgi:hypothetical protein